MSDNALATFVHRVRAAWGPLTTPLVAQCRRELETLARTSPEEGWLAELHRKAEPNHELYRDPDHGFVLLAHTERQGLHRAPHDHGRGWVVYAIQEGEIEMGSFARVADASGAVRLVERDRRVLRAGDAQAYLPGDIHDTRCLSRSALLFRFTERDLKREDREHRRVTRYVDQAGVWVPS